MNPQSPNTQQSSQDNASTQRQNALPGIERPQINLPSGGGAIRGIGETFQPNPFNGTGSLSIPVYTSPARGFEPQITLNYSSGAGNSAFGLGFDLSVPRISRRTEKGIPRYDGRDEFVLSGTEYLIPSLVKKGSQEWILDEPDDITENGITYKIRRFRPRTEGSFLRIEQWEAQGTGDIHWRVTTPDAVKHIYGKNSFNRITHPEHKHQIFTWLIESSEDSKGNKIRYEYKAEDAEGLQGEIYEINRQYKVNRYLQRIWYGNYLDHQGTEKWAFEVVFDYGEFDLDARVFQPIRPWLKRKDPFSEYRSSFEFRTLRLCRNVLMFHHFTEELGAEPCLVKATRLHYDEQAHLTKLKAVTQVGYRKQPDGSYESKSLPPLELNYTNFDPTIQEYKEITVEGQSLIADRPDQGSYQWVDMYGEGISGVLYRGKSVTLYFSPEGEGKYSSPKSPLHFPIEPHALELNYSLADVGSNTKMDVLVQEPGRVGYHEIQEDGNWSSFIPFEKFPLEALQSNQEQIDFTGDGIPDRVLLKGDEIKLYPADGQKGFQNPLQVSRLQDFPTRQSPSEEEKVLFADIFGDGGNHRVRIRNGSVECWPHLGYGKFSPKVMLDNAPRFEGRMDGQRLFFADIDGSGTADLIYVHPNRISIYYNQSGNSFSDPVEIFLPENYDQLDSIQFSDVLGNGTTAMVLTYTSPTIRHLYYDFTGNIKPHLLFEYNNNLGALSRFRYISSTQFYLRDKKAGNPWPTRLASPVQVVEKTESIDLISQSKIVSRFAYHFGAYDHIEREFAGFGMVERWDTEAFEQFSEEDLFEGQPFEVVEEGLFAKPIHTKSWYHTGIYQQEGSLSQPFKDTYYALDAQAYDMPDSFFEKAPPVDLISVREAYRALRGSMLREEIYGDDEEGEKSVHPYTVTENRFSLRLVQPKADQRYAVYMPLVRESISYHYERKVILDGNRAYADPRVAHSFQLEYNEFGQPLKTAQIVYPRRRVPGETIYAEQKKCYCTASVNGIINETDNFYRLGLPYEAKSFEIGGLSTTQGNYLSFEEVETHINAALSAEIPFHRQIGDDTEARLLIWQRLYYWNGDQNRALSLSQSTEKALMHHAETAIHSREGIAAIYADKIDQPSFEEILADMSGAGGGYLLKDNYWWNPGDIAFYEEAESFYQLNKVLDPFGAEIQFRYDDYFLAVLSSTDPLDNTITAEMDYQTLSPWRMIDINDNVSEVTFDPLGLVRATTIYGEVIDKVQGDNPISDYQPQPEPTDIQSLITQPHTYLQGATTFFHYDLFAWKRDQQPPYALLIAREQHESDLDDGSQSLVQISLEYSDGFGRVLQQKRQVEPGKALALNDLSQCIEIETDTRWLTSGRTVYNNKGNPIKQYEPFFSTTPLYQSERALTDCGVTSVLHYDPLDRVIRTDFPNHTFSKVEFCPWKQRDYDVNDTVLESMWYPMNGQPDPDGPEPLNPQERAAWLAAQHANSPTISHFDTLGRTFLSIADNKERGQHETRTVQDIQGNPLRIIDARGNAVMTYGFGTPNTASFRPAYDMQGLNLYQLSMDAGARWTLQTSDGQPLYGWDSRGHRIRSTYDVLRRPTDAYLQKTGQGEIRTSYTIYGEDAPNNKAHNLRGQAWQVYDQSGRIQNNTFDIKGNLLQSARRFATEYKTDIHWPTGNPQGQLEGEIFTSSSTYDALNRPVSMFSPSTPDIPASEIIPIYNEGNLLEQVKVKLRGANTLTTFVENIDYDAKGQRQSILYGNNTRTAYTYDPKTFRLMRMLTTRNSGGSNVQDLHYTYDPVGNITEIRDLAQQNVYFNNQVVEAHNKYTYDALYWLIQATGREHPGQNQPTSPFDEHRTQLQHPHNGQAMRRYTRKYAYDEVGNILQMLHQAGANVWKRDYIYSNNNNRLLTTKIGNTTTPYTYDAHGNITSLPHLQDMEWDFQNQLRHIQKGTTQAWYTYDASGQRARKIIQKPGGIIEKRLYVSSGFEVFRVIKNGVKELERETLHIMDDQKRIALVETKTVDIDIPNSGTQTLIRYQFSNHLQSASIELDENAQIISYEEYYPYGSTAYQAGRSQAEVKLKRYRYTGMERDEESGLNYHSARYYMCWLGRWLKPDSWGLVDGVNVYRYTRNNPIIYEDQIGQDSSNVNSSDRDDPLNYVSFESFRQGASSPWSEERLWEIWSTAHSENVDAISSQPTTRSRRTVATNSLSDEDRFQPLQRSIEFERDSFPSKRNELIEAYEKLASQVPEDYEGNIYDDILPPSATRSNYSAAAEYTARDPINNRTRWSLQSNLLQYGIEYGFDELTERAENSTEFSYRIHQSSFQFANDVNTIGRFPWFLLTEVDVPSKGESITEFISTPFSLFEGAVAGMEQFARNPWNTDAANRVARRSFDSAQADARQRGRELGGQLINLTIETTNSPHGFWELTPPVIGQGLRLGLDAISFITSPFYD